MNFGCLEKGHSEKQMLFICVNPNCNKKNSRVLCLDCLQESTHESHADHFLKVSEIDSSESFLLKQWPKNEKIKQIYIESINEKPQELEILDNFFKSLSESIQEHLLQVKKDIKIQILEGRKNIQETLNQLKIQIQKNFDILPVRIALKKFKAQETTFKEFNDILNQFAQNDQRLEEEQQILKQYTKEKQGKLFLEVNQNSIQEILNVIDQSIKGKIIKNYYDFTFQNLENNQLQNQENPNIYEGAQGVTSIYMSKQQFHRKEKVKLEFKIISCENDTNKLFFGVKRYEDFQRNSLFWYDTGNQISLNNNQYSRKPFNNQGRKQLEDIFTNGIIFRADICIEENYFKITDSENQVILENLHQFENDENWVFVFGKIGQFQIKIL